MIEPAPPTAALADACVRLGVPLRVGPASLCPIAPHAPIAGPAMPVTHAGSVDVFLEAIDDAPTGAVLVVDNGGRDDEACVGDLVTLEAREAGLAAIIIWGRHRDTAQLIEIGLPVHSRGALPPGPRRVPPAGRSMRTAWLDGVEVTADDMVAADDDGVLLIPTADWPRVLESARAIQQVETAQAERMRAGASLRAQLDFAGYRARQATEPDLSLRRYLAERGGAIEV
ncbi:RraA family protein [Microcella frigidaquae]|uniref:Putative 4-hydroxy-4-methyl-2-oxoglutarate aldolase n=1 Tax=Microcella frigidaquae TaxID=424758 RepID=A0A840XN36_9MICO|nr:RraA family protein [Microcella frigidaquae]MBB5618247.1 regulator of RNase E activity RraA [Microcella frigidaquae]NHN45867.1 RraA family protein [Microcella frigidaquae]